MAYIKRNLEATIKEYTKAFPIVVLTGPRQSGKTTTLREVFPKYQYISLDAIDIQQTIREDIRFFVHSLKSPTIIDEAQNIPELFNYIKEMVDKNPNKPGQFILSGSSQFNLLSNISESLAGRAGILHLLPLDALEIPQKYQDNHIVHGGYPKIVVQRGRNARAWFNSYIQTYIEKDIRGALKIEHLSTFRNFLDILALNCARELNLSSIARDVQVSVKTIQHWLSVLETSFIVFLLPAYHSNLRKRIVKRPKIFFYDTGLLCFLLGIETKQDLERHPFRGHIFENYIIAEVIKIAQHKDQPIKAYYLRDNHNLEVDLMLQHKNILNLVEIKYTHTPKAEFVASLRKVESLLREQKIPFKIKKTVVYRGTTQPLSTQFFNYTDFFREIF